MHPDPFLFFIIIFICGGFDGLIILVAEISGMNKCKISG